MKIMTRDFGEMDIDETEIFTFAQPIYGFETLQQYVFLYDRQFSEHFVWLQALEDPDVCFILVDPAKVTDTYPPALPESLEQDLGEEDYMCWLMVVIPDQFQAATVNLKSPIVVNPTRKRAAQIILEDDLPIRFPLFQSGRGAE